jgi:hypothetical protein
MATKKETDPTRGRKDGRLQVLLYMREELILALKQAAIEDDTTAFRLNEKAVEAFLEARRLEKKPGRVHKASKA